MKVLTITHSDSYGGAARAAYRLHCALRKCAIDSRMFVNHETLGDWTISGPETVSHKIIARVAPHIAAQLCRLDKTPNPIQRSPAFIPSPWLRRINASDADLVHMHWIGKETLSIADVSRITKPMVWTIHDMWAFNGAEHYTTDRRWRDGYHASNRPADESGWDLNRWVWRRKRKAWRKPFSIVAPSTWLAGCAAESALMRQWPVSAIPNTLDTDQWKPVNKAEARSLLGIPEGLPTVVFGAWGVEQQHKGFDLLKSALGRLKALKVDVQLLIFGQLAPERPDETSYPVHYMGHLHDDVSLRIAYSAADVMVVPSRVEAFGQSASEAMACGTPVVAFSTTGLLDIVGHKSTGYLAQPFDSEDLAAGIAWVIESKERREALGRTARSDAVTKFSYPIVARQYIDLYERVLHGSSVEPQRTTRTE